MVTIRTKFSLWLALLFLAAVSGFAQMPLPGGGGNSSASGGGGGSPGGSNTQCQYNNSGAFGGITGCTTNGTVVTLTNPVVGTQSQNDNSTKGASTAYTDLAVANAVAGVNPAIAVLAASTANVVGTYSNGVSGIGATFTVTATGAFTLDGIAINTIGQRVLLKNQSSSFQNGMYTATVVGVSMVSPVFTRALDYDTPSDINSTGAIPVQSGTANALTSWLLTSQVVTIGTDALTYTQFSYSPTSRIWDGCSSPGMGDGLNATVAGTYPQINCRNKTGFTITLTDIAAATDSGTSTCNVTNSAGTALLTGAITPAGNSTFTTGTQSATVTLANNDFLKFTFVFDGTTKQMNCPVTGTY